MQNKITAELLVSVSVKANCPKCGESFNYMNTDEYRQQSDGIMLEDGVDLELDAKCPECGHEFVINEIAL